MGRGEATLWPPSQVARKGRLGWSVSLGSLAGELLAVTSRAYAVTHQAVHGWHRALLCDVLRCAWRVRRHSPGKYRRFPFKLPKDLAVVSPSAAPCAGRLVPVGRPGPQAGLGDEVRR